MRAAVGALYRLTRAGRGKFPDIARGPKAPRKSVSPQVFPKGRICNGKKPFPVRAFAGTLFAMRPSEALAAYRDELRQLISRYHVAHPRVYGSVLTGMDDEESDLDLLVDATERTTLFTLAGLEHEAQQLLGVQVSVLTPKDLPVKFRDTVLQTAQPL
jgi:predicted nucleotidyltransferase